MCSKLLIASLSLNFLAPRSPLLYCFPFNTKSIFYLINLIILKCHIRGWVITSSCEVIQSGKMLLEDNRLAKFRRIKTIEN
ncbi:unnamed protein product [Citrullus colocynthis]|uniref:Secreted protein n=1 Tax=Citrullus colocynthis TaxID=252529 RepID=A0ABP0YU56_9ROSI